MAKDEPEADGEDGAKTGSSKKKKLILIAAGAVLLIGGGAGGYFMLKPKPTPEAAQAEAAPKKAVAFLDMREMTINLATTSSQERARFMKLKVALEVGDAKVVADIQPLLPRIEDAFQVFMRELRPSDLEGSAGVYRLREELLRRVNVAVHPAKVDAILFKELLVQ